MKHNMFMPLPLAEVEVTDSYCKNALHREVCYLLSLQEGRLLAGFCENAGIKTPYVRYGGWESGLIGGHTLGHYLTALAQGAVDPAVPASHREKLLLKMKNIVNCLAECQKAAGIGLVWGAPPIAGGIEAQFDHVERGETDIYTQAWVPWYTLHKILAGLEEAFRLTGYAPALEVAEGLGDWVFRRVSRWGEALRKKVLETEYGGMNDCLYQLYALTGKQEYAHAAHCFDEEELFRRIHAEEPNALNDLHANTTIPKFLGAIARYLALHGKMLDGKKVDATFYLEAAMRFFAQVTEHHTYVTGGNSEWERFGEDDVLNAERTRYNCETCNVYNMMKLARRLFSVTGDKRYSDYYENAFLNDILSSQHPETGMTTYFQAMASGYFKVFSTAEENFWCCTGTGMENFTKLGDGIYYRRGKDLYVERYLPSAVHSEEAEIEVTGELPWEEKVHISIRRAKEPFRLFLKVPAWAAAFPEVFKNGEKVKFPEADSHLAVTVEEGDELILSLKAEISMKGLPDGHGVFAFCYGGMLLSTPMGEEDMQTETTGVEVTVPAGEPKEAAAKVNSLYQLFSDPSGYFAREGESFVMKSQPPLRFTPHYKQYRSRYGIYIHLEEE